MAGWGEVQDEIASYGSGQDFARKKYLGLVASQTERNVVAYYSGFLTPGRPDGLPVSIDDSDMSGFMSVFQGLNRDMGLDLLLHTPGGDVAATEALIKYIRSMFSDVRVIVPQLAMSGGTMIALSANSVIMGRHSSLGPIDPQVGGVPAGAIVEEFRDAVDAVKKDPSTAPIYQQMVSRYPAAFVGQCEKAVQWARKIATDSLTQRMFAAAADPGKSAKAVVDELGSHSASLNHSRHYSFDQVKALGVTVEALESNQSLQDAVLSYHHAAMITFNSSGAFKIFENHKGVTVVGSFQALPGAVSA